MLFHATTDLRTRFDYELFDADGLTALCTVWCHWRLVGELGDGRPDYQLDSTEVEVDRVIFYLAGERHDIAGDDAGAIADLLKVVVEKKIAKGELDGRIYKS